MIEGRNARNVPTIKKIIIKRKTKKWNINVNINDDSQRVITLSWDSGKDNPIGVVGDTN